MMQAPVLDPKRLRALRPFGVMAAAFMLTLTVPAMAKGGIPAEQAERVAKDTEKDVKRAAKVAEKVEKAQDKVGSSDDDATRRTTLQDARASSKAEAGTGAGSAPDEPTPDEPTQSAAPLSNPPSARASLNARTGDSMTGGIPPMVKYGLLAMFVVLLGAIGALLWSNMRLKRQLASVAHAQSDPARAGGRRTLVSEQDHGRPRPPYQGEGQGGDTGYTQRGAAPSQGYASGEPRIMGDDHWTPDLPAGQGHSAPSGGAMGAQGFPAAPPPPPPPAPVFQAPSGPTLRLPMANVQELVRRAPEMAASEFRAAANALGQWREVNVNGTGGTLHLGEEDGLPRPLIAILQDDGSAVVVPSAQYARDFAFQHYKIRNSESLRPFFDLELSSRTELAYSAPCIVAIEGQNVRVVQRGVLSGFSD